MITAGSLGIPAVVQILVVGVLRCQRGGVLPIPEPLAHHFMILDNGSCYLIFLRLCRDFRRTVSTEAFTGNLDLHQTDVSIVITAVAAGKDQLYEACVLNIQILYSKYQILVIGGHIFLCYLCHQVEIHTVGRGVQFKEIGALIKCKLEAGNVIIAFEHIDNTGFSRVTTVRLGIPAGIEVLIVCSVRCQRIGIFPIPYPGANDHMLGNLGCLHLFIGIRNGGRRFPIQLGTTDHDFH